MPQKKREAEEIVAKLRQVDVLTSQGGSVSAMRLEWGRGAASLPGMTQRSPFGTSVPDLRP
jgi:hypothetical protein